MASALCMIAVVFIGFILFAVSYAVYTGSIKADFRWLQVFHHSDKLYRKIRLFGVCVVPIVGTGLHETILWSHVESVRPYITLIAGQAKAAAVYLVVLKHNLNNYK
jgi:hypothetical protein